MVLSGGMVNSELPQEMGWKAHRAAGPEVADSPDRMLRPDRILVLHVFSKELMWWKMIKRIIKTAIRTCKQPLPPLLLFVCALYIVAAVIEADIFVRDGKSKCVVSLSDSVSALPPTLTLNRRRLPCILSLDKTKVPIPNRYTTPRRNRSEGHHVGLVRGVGQYSGILKMNSGMKVVPHIDKSGDCTSGGRKSGKSKRVRTIFTPEQLERLEAEFERQQYMVGPERLYLAHALQLTEAQVKVWFQNRRIKWRKQHLELQQQRLAALKQQQHLLQHDQELESDQENSRGEQQHFMVAQE
ncbi:hypothetical protein J6590_029088 [Homalodisca vitripennis]|nr:hypothetical protein J6590_029088 [Homalodisca vitripennis]